MLQMRIYSYTESIYRTFLKITTSTTMYVHLYASWHDIHATGIDQVGSNDGQVTIGHLEDLIVTQDDRTILQPSLRSEYLTVYNLC